MRLPRWKLSPLLWGAPFYLLLLFVLWPVIQGAETFFLRDAFNAHLPLKAAQAHALSDGRMPLVAPELGGGQPLAGNPNAVPFYPDNLLYLLLPLLGAFNLHFWLHWLLAPWGVYWLAREWGLSRSAAWGAGVFYATGGFFASLLNFYNLVAGAALAPVLAAALLAYSSLAYSSLADSSAATSGLALSGSDAKSRRRWIFAALAGSWALLLVAGDPATAVVALGLAVGGVLLRRGREALRLRIWGAPVVALAGGTLLAAPQIIEFLRILPLSYRGHRGFSESGQVVGSLHPGQLLEWLLPFLYGRPDRMREGAFWGYELYGGDPPIFFTLYPGLLVLALVVLALLPRLRRKKEAGTEGPEASVAPEGWRPCRRAGLIFVGAGFFLALGGFNPLWGLLQSLPGAGLLRYPVKLWLPAAVGLVLLAGVGLQRVLDEPKGAGRQLRHWLLALAAGYAGLWLLLSFAPPAAAWVRAAVPRAFGDVFVDNERLRWAGLALLTTVALVVMVVAVSALRRRPMVGGALLLAVHVATQLFFLGPARATDEAAYYRQPPPLLEQLPPEAPVLHGSADALFGRYDLRRGRYPDASAQWIERRIFRDLYPVAGVLHHRRYELNLSPEGLGSFFSRVAQDAVRRSSDEERLRLLSAWGVQRLLTHRPLEVGAAAPVLAVQQGFGGELRVHAVPGATDEVFFVAEVRTAADMGSVVGLLVSPSFDPTRTAIVAGAGVDSEAIPSSAEDGGSSPSSSSRSRLGSVEILRREAEQLEVRVSSPEGGAVVWQRAWLPLYRATVDGREQTVEVANLHRMAVRVPAGEHVVRIATDRRPLALGTGLSALGLLWVAGWAWWLGKGAEQGSGGKGDDPSEASGSVSDGPSEDARIAAP
ncbi:MAG: hypothetical protein SX243_02040 [Acidobacteriota bacterium]|nr:hypothetical protein [Acidobacteriota bacterium]